MGVGFEDADIGFFAETPVNVPEKLLKEFEGVLLSDESIIAAAEGKTEFPFTSGKNMYDFVDVDDLAEMIAKASVQDEVDGIINVCTGEPMTLADRVEAYIREHNYNIKLQYGAFPDRPYDSPGVWGDTTKIRQIMGGK